MNALANRIALLSIWAVLAWTPPARAQMVSTYTMPAPVLTVVDLAPGDGVAPGVDIVSVQTTLTADITWPVGGQSDRSTPPPFTAGAAELSSGATTLSARTDGTLNDLMLHVTAFPGEAHMEAKVTGEQVITFTLTPHSRLSLAGHLSLRGGWEGTEHAVARSSGWVFAGLLPPDDPWGISILRSLQIYDTQPAPAQQELDYLLSYSNMLDEIVTLTWTLQSSLEIEVQPLAAVPEVPAWTMMLAGMLLYGAGVARPRQRRASR